MDEKVIHLEDGTTVEAKVNFATLYYMQKFNVEKLINRYEKEKNDEDGIELMARMLHVILLSNGRICTFEEALVLMPLDDEEFEAVLSDFSAKVEDYKKKQEQRTRMKNFQASV